MPVTVLPATDVQELLSLASVESLCVWRRSSELAANVAAAEVLGRVSRELACNFRFPDALSHAMKTFSAILCGDFVVNVLEPKEKYGRVDFIVPKHTFWGFIEFLEDSEDVEYLGFVRVLSTMHRNGYKHAVDFRCPEKDGQPGTVVRIIRSNATSPLYSVPYFFSTHLMNVITHDRLIVPYPALTFARTGVDTWLNGCTFQTPEIGIFRSIRRHRGTSHTSVAEPLEPRNSVVTERLPVPSPLPRDLSDRSTRRGSSN